MRDNFPLLFFAYLLERIIQMHKHIRKRDIFKALYRIEKRFKFRKVLWKVIKLIKLAK